MYKVSQVAQNYGKGITSEIANTGKGYVQQVSQSYQQPYQQPQQSYQQPQQLYQQPYQQYYSPSSTSLDISSMFVVKLVVKLIAVVSVVYLGRQFWDVWPLKLSFDEILNPLKWPSILTRLLNFYSYYKALLILLNIIIVIGLYLAFCAAVKYNFNPALVMGDLFGKLATAWIPIIGQVRLLSFFISCLFV